MNTKLSSFARPYVQANKDKIIAKEKVTILRIHSDSVYPSYKFLSKTFGILSDFKANIELINISEVSISVALSQMNVAEEIRNRLSGFAHTDASYNWAVVHIVSDPVPDEESFQPKLVMLLREIPLRMISYSGQKNMISIVVHIKDKEEALEIINSFLRKRQPQPLKKEILCV